MDRTHFQWDAGTCTNKELYIHAHVRVRQHLCMVQCNRKFAGERFVGGNFMTTCSIAEEVGHCIHHE